MKQEKIRWLRHQLDHMQIIYTLLQTDNNASWFNCWRTDALADSQPTVSKHWRQNKLNTFIIVTFLPLWYAATLQVLFLNYSNNTQVDYTFIHTSAECHRWICWNSTWSFVSNTCQTHVSSTKSYAIKDNKDSRTKHSAVRKGASIFYESYYLILVILMTSSQTPFCHPGQSLF